MGACARLQVNGVLCDGNITKLAGPHVLVFPHHGANVRMVLFVDVAKISVISRDWFVGSSRVYLFGVC